MLGGGAWPGGSGKSEEKKKQVGIWGDGGGRRICTETERVRKVTKQLCVCVCVLSTTCVASPHWLSSANEVFCVA